MCSLHVHLAAEIWRHNDFQNGGRPACWIFEIGHRKRAIMPPNSKFLLNRTIYGAGRVIIT